MPSLINKELKIKLKLRYPLTPLQMVIISTSSNNKPWTGVEKKVPSYSVGVHLNVYNHYGPQDPGNLKIKYKMTV